jgi:hypothetical protein
VLVWVRVVWFALGAAGAVALTVVLEGRSTPVTVVAVALAALAWGAGIVAVLVPRSASLTVLRVLGVGALLPAAAVDAFVDGSSYGSERRFALRTPAPLLFGPVELAWLAIVAPFVAGALLLAAKQWIVGVVLLLLGVAAARPALRSLHQLSRRWVVFVPAGVVVHDPIVLTDAAMFPKRMVRRLGPAPVQDAEVALDITGRAPGLVLELQLVEAVPVALVDGRKQSRTVETDRVLVTPSRPGAVLAEARQRGVPTP